MDHDYDHRLALMTLYQHVQDLHHYIQELHHYVAKTKVYEYHIQKISIKKITGTLQLGQLLNNNQGDFHGIHRFFIANLHINEIEENGTVGIGIREKNYDQQQTKIVSPQEASKETKQIYKEIQTLLDINQVPHFFQTLANKENVLKKVWTTVTNTWGLNDDFNHVYTAILALLNRLPFPTFHPSDGKLNNSMGIAVADHIESCSKTFVIITFLIQNLLPHYLNEQQKKQHLSPESFKQLDTQMTPKQLLTAVKNGFQINHLPPSYQRLQDFPNISTALYDAFVNELTPPKNLYHTYVQNMYELCINEVTRHADESLFITLHPKEVGFLCTRLMDDFTIYQKHLFLNYMLLPLCNNDA